MLHPSTPPAKGRLPGQLINSEKNPFDVSLAGDEADKALKIELRNTSGIMATTFPQKDKSRFSFSHVTPGSYEISVALTIPGKRTDRWKHAGYGKTPVR